jgi:lipopolysaccharide transport system ATP-binding protein
MSDKAIIAEMVSKRYRIGLKEQMHNSISGAFASWIKKPMKNYYRLRSLSKFDDNGERGDILWALREVSFEVKEGEVLGIIGRNGAGKSTLLKILSRITNPSSGTISIKGTVSSLLEVGTGFHPELTGRENIYLNGTIIGMSKREIDKKFDEIVDFSGVEKFIDTPIKRYSTGMAVRLAFAVAAHIDPEVMIIDEVLAVGDAEFQKKCMGKMSETAKGGRTVIFVSHNMPSITGLCHRVILLHNGQISKEGDPQDVVAHYLGHSEKVRSSKTWTDLSIAPGNEIVRLRRALVRDNHGNSDGFFDIREPIAVEMEYDVLVDGHILVPNFYFFKEMNLLAFLAIDQDPKWKNQPKPRGRYKSTVWIPGNFLSDGEMSVSVAITTYRPKVAVHFEEEYLLSFQIIDSLDGNTARGEYTGNLPGVIRPLLEWETTRSDVKKNRTKRILSQDDNTFG